MTDLPPGSPLPTVNSTAQLIDTTVVDLGQKGIALAETALLAQFPWLGFWGLKQIWESIFEYFSNQLLDFLGTFAGYVVIDIQKYIDLKEAASALIALNAAKQTGDQNAISKASSDVDEAVAPILHYVGSTGGN